MLVMTCLLLTACTMKSLYLQLDWLIPQFIGEYIPLTVNQEQELKLQLQKTILWHRNTQLHEYVNWLRTFQKDIPQGLSETRVLHHYKQLEQFWKTLLSFMADDTAVLLFSTNNEQRDYLFKTFERKNDDYQKKYIQSNDDVIRSNLLIRITEEYERWIGDVEPAQQLLIKNATAKLKLTGTLLLKNHLILQNELKKILNTSTSVDQLKVEIKNLFLHWKKFRSHEYEKVLEYNQTILLKLTSDISLMLNTKQKNYLNQKIDSYIKLFSELSTITN